NQVEIVRAVEAGQPDVYGGAVAFHALTIWCQRIFRLNYFFAFSALFYLTMALLAFSTALYCWRRDIATPWRIATVFVTGAATLFYWMVFPIVAMLQSDGFHTQWFSLYPICLALLALKYLESPLSRLIALGFLTVLQRYTYPLNLADLVLADA